MDDPIERLSVWASQHSNVTPLDGNDRDSPTFGDLRALIALARGGDAGLELAQVIKTHKVGILNGLGRREREDLMEALHKVNMTALVQSQATVGDRDGQ